MKNQHNTRDDDNLIMAACLAFFIIVSLSSLVVFIWVMGNKWFK